MHSHIQITELPIVKKTKPYTLGPAFQTLRVPFSDIASARVGTSKFTNGLNTFSLTDDKSIRFCEENANEIFEEVQNIEWGYGCDVILYYNSGRTNKIHKTKLFRPKTMILFMNLSSTSHEFPASASITKSRDYEIQLTSINDSHIIPPSYSPTQVASVSLLDSADCINVSAYKLDTFSLLKPLNFHVDNPLNRLMLNIAEFKITFFKSGAYDLNVPGGIFIV